jgi:hypothetical protein
MFVLFYKECDCCWVPVAHSYNPSYLGRRDQEDHSSLLACGKKFLRRYLEKDLSQKWAGGVAQSVQSEFKP